MATTPENADPEQAPLLAGRIDAPGPDQVPSDNASNDASHGASHGASRDDDDDDDAPPPISRRRGLAIALSLWALIFLQAANMSGMTMAQSAVAADLDAYDAALWFTSAYLIATAAFAPLAGRLASLFSARHLVAGAAACFALGAVPTSAARSLPVFLLGRVIAGVGGAGVMTLSLITVLQLTGKRRRGLFVGLVNAGFTIGLTSGAVVYGALLPAVGWRTLFLVQAPLALLAGVAVLFSMPHGIHRPDSHANDDDDDDDDDDETETGTTTTAAANKHPRRSVWQKLARIDYAGAVLLTTTSVLFLYGLSGTVRPLALVLSGVALVCFVGVEALVVPRLSAAPAGGGGDPVVPLVPLDVLRSPAVLLTCLAQLGVMAARWTVLYYAPIYLLAVRGAPPAAAGAALLPTNAGFGTGGLVVGWLHVRRAGAFWLPSLVALGLFSGSLAVVGALSTAPAAETAGTAGTGTAEVFLAGTAPFPLAYTAALFFNGFCTGAFLNYTLAHLLHRTRPAVHFLVTSLLATFRGFSGSFGTSLGGGFFARRLAVALVRGFADLDDGNERAALVRRLVGSPALVFGRDAATGAPVLTAAERAVAVAGYAEALGSLYRWAAVVSGAMVVLQAGTGWADAARRSGEGGGGGGGGGLVVGGAVAVAADEEEDEEEEEEEILEAMIEHETTMEA